MPKIDVSGIKRREYFEALLKKYGKHPKNPPPWFQGLYRAGFHSRVKSERDEKEHGRFLKFVEEIWKETCEARASAFDGFIKEGEWMVRRKRWRLEVERRLKALGGKLSHLRRTRAEGQEKEKVEGQIERLQLSLKIAKRPRIPMRRAQYDWHNAMVVAYENLPESPIQRKRKMGAVNKLCQWLSIPELKIQCTPQTIKAARRRFTTVEIDGRKYPAYTATQRGKRG